MNKQKYMLHYHVTVYLELGQSAKYHDHVKNYSDQSKKRDNLDSLIFFLTTLQNHTVAWIIRKNQPKNKCSEKS